MASFTFSFCAVIHITRKKAIMAVTKSAYATFRAPPCLPDMRVDQGSGVGSQRSGVGSRGSGVRGQALAAGIDCFEKCFQLLLGGADVAAEAAAGYFQNDLRRLIVGKAL